MQYNMRDCGARILWLRRNAGFSQNELAEKLNISPEHYRAVESGRHGCSIDLLVDLATLFDVSLDYLVLGRRLHSDSSSSMKTTALDRRGAPTMCLETGAYCW